MKPETIVAFLCELIETHMEKCDPDGLTPEIKHILSATDKQSTNIDHLGNPKPNQIKLQLDNGEDVYIDITVV